MPYIPQDEREDLDELAGALVTNLRNGNFRGKLNYFISLVADGLMQANGLSYSFLNDFIGVLECVKLELYRRVATPYEDEKKNENGDVFSSTLIQPSELEKKLSKDKANLAEYDRKISKLIREAAKNTIVPSDSL